MSGEFWRYFEGRFGDQAAHKLGYPYNFSHRWGPGWVQDLDGGSMGWNILMMGDRVGRVHTVFGGIRDKYIALGGAPEFLGFPTSDEYSWNGEVRQNFEGGSIIWNASDGARLLDPDAPAEAGIAYVALGDSYSSGEGVPFFDNTHSGVFTANDEPAQGDTFCHRSEHAYARQLAVRRGIQNVRLFACSGAETKHFFDQQLSGLFHLWAGEPAPRQLDHLTGAVNLVSLSVGGNDVGFAGILRRCAHPKRIACDLTEITGVRERLAALRPNLVSLYRRMDERLGDGSRVYVMGYPQIFNADDGWCSLGFQKRERAFFRRSTTATNDIIEAAVNEIRSDPNTTAYFQFVDVEDELDEGQLCSGAEVLVFHGASLTHLEFSYHPNILGQRELALALDEAIGPAI